MPNIVIEEENKTQPKKVKKRSPIHVQSMQTNKNHRDEFIRDIIFCAYNISDNFWKSKILSLEKIHFVSTPSYYIINNYKIPRDNRDIMLISLIDMFHSDGIFSPFEEKDIEFRNEYNNAKTQKWIDIKSKNIRDMLIQDFYKVCDDKTRKKISKYLHGILKIKDVELNENGISNIEFYTMT